MSSVFPDPPGLVPPGKDELCSKGSFNTLFLSTSRILMLWDFTYCNARLCSDSAKEEYAIPQTILIALYLWNVLDNAS